MNNITIHDLAKIAGVNPSTVSRALRGDPRVRQSTRDRMTELAAQYGYVPNLNARNLADGRTRMIALLSAPVADGQVLLFARGRAVPQDMAALLRQSGARGGGKPDWAQGSAKEDGVLESAAATLTSLR